MLQFTEDYFKTEKRDGFIVNELMKRAWAAQLEVLTRIIGICEKYDLTYYAFGGTLLGAVRHHGYIPWDDDLDIAMKRDDYLKFLEVAKTELPREYCILNAETENEYENVFTRITNGHSVNLSEQYLEEYHDCPFVVGVDIFPLYYIPRDREQAEAQKSILQLINTMHGLLERATVQEQAEVEEQIAECLNELQEVTGYQFTAEKPIQTQLQIVFDLVGRIFGEEESDALTSFPVYLQENYSYVIEKELLAECIPLPFESFMINAPKGYDELLKKIYHDYMVPQNMRGGHDYPFYKGQLRALGEYIEKQDCEWKQQRTDSLENGAVLVTDEKTGVQMPGEWLKKIKNKKVMLYHTSADALLCHGEFALEKLHYVFEIVRKNKEIVLWWVPCFLDSPKMPFIKKISPQLVEEYRQALEEFQQGNFGIYDDTADMRRAVAVADAYYGDESELSQLFRKTGKDLMIQDYEIVQ